jgi:hypothetical protein
MSLAYILLEQMLQVCVANNHGMTCCSSHAMQVEPSTKHCGE